MPLFLMNNKDLLLKVCNIILSHNNLSEISDILNFKGICRKFFLDFELKIKIIENLWNNNPHANKIIAKLKNKNITLEESVLISKPINNLVIPFRQFFYHGFVIYLIRNMCKDLNLKFKQKRLNVKNKLTRKCAESFYSVYIKKNIYTN